MRGMPLHTESAPHFGATPGWRRHAPFAIWMTLVGIPICWYILGPKGEPVELVSKTWQRDIVVERLSLELSSGWCDEMPADAELISRKPMVDPSGQRQVPSDHCRFKAAQWMPYRSLRTEGAAPVQPVWAASTLAQDAADALGAERLGKRHERYEVTLLADSGKTWTCRMPQTQWQTLPVGLRFRLKVDRFGVADCRSLDQHP